MLDENTIIKERYSLIKLLGRGGFSEVWLARDNITSVQVALKIYAPDTGLDNEGIELFTREFSLVFDVNHTNLLRPIHYDYFNMKPFLVLPYCQKGSCYKLIGNMPEREIWNFLYDVSSGLNFLHSRTPPIIHQDIKPDNILIDAGGSYMITDFGISTRIRSTLRKSVNTEKTSGGTLAYMAPERFGANPTPIIANDIYSLGATVYELITGDAPFGDHGGLIQKNGADIPAINSNEYSSALKKLVTQCLSVHPWERPSALQIQKYAQDALDGKAIKVNGGKKQLSGINKKWTGIIAGCTLLILGVVFLGSSLLSPGKPDVYNQYSGLIHVADSLKAEGNKKQSLYEQQYVKALTTYKQALEYEEFVDEKKSLSPLKRIDETQQLMIQAYNELSKKAEAMQEYGEYEAATSFKNRAESIKGILDNE